MYKFLFICMFSFNLYSQEVVKDLIYNPYLDFNVNKKTHESKSALSLPFIDDFSYAKSFPDTILWKNRSVFVNRNYAINPITIGVATFDGLDKYGRAYDMSYTGLESRNADTLTSQKIDLSTSDTIYFMFYYQAQGIGNDPQISDSIILDFSSGIDSNGNVIWNTVWRKEGTVLHEFKKHVLISSDSNYLTNEFQFRFRNLATVSGNFDHWHIDYIKLDNYYSSVDTSTLNDVAFIQETPMLLKRYREMPWIHFVNDVSQEMNDSIDILLRNNTSIIQSIDYRYDVFKNGNQVYHYPVLGGNNSTRNVDVPPYSSSGNYAFNTPPIMLDDQMFPLSSSDSSEFLFRNSIKTEPSDLKMNDTVSHLQRFYSHFSYDDGTAELAYGINNQGAKIAYEFKLNRPDSLRMIQMKFIEMNEDLTDKEFILTVWNKNSGYSGPGQVLYQDTVYLEYKDRDKFTNYYLKNAVGLVGTFFVGWEQITDDILNLGLDKNLTANDYMYYNIGGGWVNSQFPGSWMIRPVLNYTTPIISLDNINNKINFSMYPNPFSDITNLYFDHSKKRQILIFDLSGRCVKSIVSSEKIIRVNNVNMTKGMYFVQVIESGLKYTKKLILN